MLAYTTRRLFLMVVTMVVVSILAFLIIDLPPGDYLASYLMRLEQSGQTLSQEALENLRREYGLDLPLWQRYGNWVWNFLHGNLGRSFEWNRPVSELLAERLLLTIIISLITLVFAYGVAVPVGIYSGLRQYSAGDYLFTALGFIGLAIPNFLLALALMFFFFKYLGWSPGGLFSTEYQIASWSFAKFIDMLKHLPVPVVVIGTAGTAALIRVMRGCLLDELRRQYVVTARSKGLPELRLTFKYPVRVAINPIVSTVGWTLPAIVSGETITAIVLNLPTTGPLLYGALISQDSYLAGSTVMFLSFLTVVGTLCSDLLLMFIDPRIRHE